MVERSTRPFDSSRPLKNSETTVAETPETRECGWPTAFPWRHRRPSRNPPRPLPTSRASCQRRVPAAAVACTSSKCSRAGASRGIGQHRCAPGSGSTRHEGTQSNGLQLCRSPPLVVHRQHPLVPDRARSTRETPIRLARDAIEEPSRPPLDPGHGPNARVAHTSISHQRRRPASIPIELVAPPRPISRDFVPWRFSDAGLQRVATASPAGVRETCTDWEAGEWPPTFVSLPESGPAEERSSPIARSPAIQRPVHRRFADVAPAGIRELFGLI